MIMTVIETKNMNRIVIVTGVLIGTGVGSTQGPLHLMRTKDPHTATRQILTAGEHPQPTFMDDLPHQHTPTCINLTPRHPRTCTCLKSSKEP